MSQEDIQKLVRERLRERNINMTEASRLVGRNDAYIQQFLERGTPKRLPETVREALAPALGLDPDDLRNDKPIDLNRGGTRATNTQTPQTAVALPLTIKDLPIMGATRGGYLGASSFADNGETFGMVARPPSLTGVLSAYAVFSPDDTMSPRYMVGEILHVNPYKPCTPGSFVVVQTKEKDGPRDYLVKRLVRQSGGKVWLAQFNPDLEFGIPSETVVAIHRIVGTAEDA